MKTKDLIFVKMTKAQMALLDTLALSIKAEKIHMVVSYEVDGETNYFRNTWVKNAS